MNKWQNLLGSGFYAEATCLHGRNTGHCRDHVLTMLQILPTNHLINQKLQRITARSESLALRDVPLQKRFTDCTHNAHQALVVAVRQHDARQDDGVLANCLKAAILNGQLICSSSPSTLSSLIGLAQYSKNTKTNTNNNILHQLHGNIDCRVASPNFKRSLLCSFVPVNMSCSIAMKVLVYTKIPVNLSESLS